VLSVSRTGARECMVTNENIWNIPKRASVATWEWWTLLVSFISFSLEPSVVTELGAGSVLFVA